MKTARIGALVRTGLGSLIWPAVIGSAIAGTACGEAGSDVDQSGDALKGKTLALPAGTSLVNDEDERWHDMSRVSPLAYEWFYFDVATDDGDQLAISFLGPNTFDVDLGVLQNPDGIKRHTGISVQASLKDGRRLEVLDFRREASTVTFSESPWRLQIGSSVLTMEKGARGLRNYHLELDSVDPKTNVKVNAELRFKSTMAGFKLNDGNVFHEPANGPIPEQFHKWVITSPKAEVSGSFTFTEADGRATQKRIRKGSGYHDHNWGTLPLGAGTDGWYWWRAEVGEDVVVGAHLWGKQTDPFTDKFYVRPPSDILFIGDEKGPKLFTDKVAFTADEDIEFGDLRNGMKGPRAYGAEAKSSDGTSFKMKLTPRRTTTDSKAYYFRQAGKLELSVGSRAPKSGVAVSEQIDLARFSQLMFAEAAQAQANAATPPPAAPAPANGDR